MDDPKYNDEAKKYSALISAQKGAEGTVAGIVGVLVGYGAAWVLAKTGIALDGGTQAGIVAGVVGILFGVKNWLKNCVLK
jgi:hypothetical protein